MKKSAQESGEKTEPEEVNEDDDPKTAPSRGMSMLDFIMRIVAAISFMGSAIAMGTSGQTLNFFKEFVHFRGQFQDLPTFRFFVVSNAIAAAYLVLSLALSAFHILKTGAKMTRSVLIILDMIILALLTAGASAAAAIAYFANRGNDRFNWSAICHQYNSFCERLSGSLVGSFLGALVLMLLISLSAVALSRQ